MILRLATANENRSEGEGTTSVVPSPSHQSHRPKLFSCTVARSPARRGGKSSSCPCGPTLRMKKMTAGSRRAGQSFAGQTDLRGMAISAMTQLG